MAGLQEVSFPGKPQGRLDDSGKSARYSLTSILWHLRYATEPWNRTHDGLFNIMSWQLGLLPSPCCLQIRHAMESARQMLKQCSEGLQTGLTPILCYYRRSTGHHHCLHGCDILWRV